MNFDILYTSEPRPLFLNYISDGFDKAVDILSMSNLNTISLKFWWYDDFHKLYPLLIPFKGNACAIRLCFEETDL